MPVPTGPQGYETHRVAPYSLSRDQQWARDQLAVSHLEALYALGEYAMFVLLWRAADLNAGLVGRCQRCYLSRGAVAEAFEQPGQARCPDCFGTTFEGGYRAAIIRPSIWGDSAPDTTQTPRGEVRSDSMSVETTADFTLHHGDWVFRAGGTRWRALELAGSWARTGFADPRQASSVAGLIPQARLEDRVASAAYDVPPAQEALDALLRRPIEQHLPPDLSSVEVVRGPLVV
jgi:hypothetical protein